VTVRLLQDRLHQPTPDKISTYRLLKYMLPESSWKNTSQDMTYTTPDLSRNITHFSRLSCPEQSLKTELEGKNHEKIFDGSRSLPPEGQCVNGRLDEQYDDQGVHLL
jgi:hypothetical protein